MYNSISNIDIYLIISKNIRKYRLASGMTQKELAVKSGYSYAYIRRMEGPRCAKNFSIQTLLNISIALNIDIKNLFEKNNIQ